MNICVNLNSRSQNKAQIWLYHRLFQIFRLGGCRWLHWRQNSDCPNHSRGTWQIIGDISTRSTLRGAASHRFQHQGLSTLDQETWEDVVVNKQVETNGCCCKQESGQKWTSSSRECLYKVVKRSSRLLSGSPACRSRGTRRTRAEPLCFPRTSSTLVEPWWWEFQ